MTVEARIFAVLMAVSLQITATLPVGAHGLRIGLSDLLLPVAGLTILRQWARLYPARTLLMVSGWPWWLAAMTVALTLSLIVGYRFMGEWSNWAFVNKFLGWFALLGYLFVGAALSRILGDNFRRETIAVFTLAAGIIAGLSVLAYPLIFQLKSAPILITDYRLTGLLQNSNAFGFLLVVAFALTIAVPPARLGWICASACLAGVWFTASRGAMLAAVVAAVTLAVLRARPRRDILIATAGAAVFAAVISGLTLVWVGGGTSDEPIGLVSEERISADSWTIEYRKSATQQAFSLFQRSPLLGVGLGGFMWTIDKHTEDESAPRTIHNSALWLLTEMGLVGAVPIIAFLITCWFAIWGRRDGDFPLGMVAVGFAFMAISMTGEFLYQRHLWFLLGMALATPNSGQESTWRNASSGSV